MPHLPLCSVFINSSLCLRFCRNSEFCSARANCSSSRYWASSGSKSADVRFLRRSFSFIRSSSISLLKSWVSIIWNKRQTDEEMEIYILDFHTIFFPYENKWGHFILKVLLELKKQQQHRYTFN